MLALVPAWRRHDASKFGQACCEQFLPMVRISSRSLLASGCGTLASTVGAKPGRRVRAAATHAAIAIAERALIIDGPLWMRPLRPVCGPSFVGQISNHGQFPDVFADTGNGFVRGPFCFV